MAVFLLQSSWGAAKTTPDVRACVGSTAEPPTELSKKLSKKGRRQRRREASVASEALGGGFVSAVASFTSTPASELLGTAKTAPAAASSISEQLATARQVGREEWLRALAVQLTPRHVELFGSLWDETEEKPSG